MIKAKYIVSNQIGFLIFVLALLSLPAGCYSQQSDSTGRRENQSFTELRDLQKAFAERQSDLQVKQQGIIVKVLSDDTRGSKHQRFIVKLASGQKLLIAHNIDLAPRVPNLDEGSKIGFYGEFEWNSKGGVIHWTHHDPEGRHADGWLEYEGKRYD